MKILCAGMLSADVIATPVDYCNLNEDTILTDRIEVKNGGDCMNVAVGLAKLGCEVSFCGAVGDDLFGKFLTDTLVEHGVNTDHLLVRQGMATGSCIALVKEDGQRIFLYSGAASKTLSVGDVTPALELRNHQHFHVSGGLQLPMLDGAGVAQLFERAKSYGMTTSMDVTWDSSGRWIELLEPCLGYLDLFMPSENEAAMLTGQRDPDGMADFFISRGVGTVVIKLGVKGAFIKGKDFAFCQPAFPADVVDTTGAGDSFTAGFLCRYTQGAAPGDCALFASAVAAHCITALGATDGIPTRRQVEEFINNEKPPFFCSVSKFC